MDLAFDAAKRDQTLLERGLDFARAQEVFEGIHFTGQDSRINYTETGLSRWVSWMPA
jgi:uncharacterized DUF497 family protein